MKITVGKLGATVPVTRAMENNLSIHVRLDEIERRILAIEERLNFLMPAEHPLGLAVRERLQGETK